jgi:hypothetical protein
MSDARREAVRRSVRSASVTSSASQHTFDGSGPSVTRTRPPLTPEAPMPKVPVLVPVLVLVLALALVLVLVAEPVLVLVGPVADRRIAGGIQKLPPGGGSSNSVYNRLRSVSSCNVTNA